VRNTSTFSTLEGRHTSAERRVLGLERRAGRLKGRDAFSERHLASPAALLTL
jgi:hypothetical protein